VDRRAGSGRGVGKDAIEDVAPRRHEVVDAGPRLDRADLLDVTGAEQDLPDRRRTAGEDRVQQPPLRQLHDATAGEPVRRERVAGYAASLDHGHPVAQLAEQHRGGRTGAPCTHDDDVALAPAHAGKAAVARRIILGGRMENPLSTNAG
jgi:hypothetical protein